MNPILKVAGLATGLMLMGLLVSAQTGPAFVIIVNNDNPTSSMSQKQVSDIFLKKTTAWPNEAAAVPVDLEPSSLLRATFSEQVHGRPLAAVQSYWQQLIFSGQGVPPRVVASESEVVAFVRNHSGGIGYVSTGALLDGVKTLSVRMLPRILERVAPTYPAAAQRAKIRGNVVLRVEIGKKGNVVDVIVIRGLSHGLTEAAIEAVEKWKFSPATQDGVPVQEALTVAVSFKLS